VWCDLMTHAKLDDSTFARPAALPSK
jgi:hypothetical protein